MRLESDAVRLIAALVAGLAAPPALAESGAPKAAIDWLTRPSPGAAAPGGTAGETDGAAVGEIETVAIGVAALDSAGALDEAESGVTLDFWRGVSALRAGALLRRVRGSGTLAAARLYRRLLLARTRPPAATGPGGGFLRLRVERLLQTGALADARELLEASGARGPAFVEYALTIGQLTAEDRGPCTDALAGDAAALAIESRIYCRIRLGDVGGALVEISEAREAGRADPALLDLLEAQIDSDLAATAEGPSDVAALSPLALALIDGIGAPRPANFSAAPAAYYWADLTEAAPPRDQLRAAERLARTGAIPAERLAALYASRRAAESGGVWGRVEAWRAMEAAPPAERAEAVAEMDRRAAAAGLRAALAAELNDRARDAPAEGETALRLAEIALLAGDAATARARMDDDAPARLRALLALLEGRSAEFPEVEAAARRGDAAAQRLAAALAAFSPAEEPLDRSDAALKIAEAASETPAAATLEALEALDAGGEIAPAELHAALTGLVSAGFAADARAVAVETVLAERGP